MNRKNFYKYAIRLTLPIVLQNLMSATISSTDVVMLNYVGQSSISAVSLASSYASVIFMIYAIIIHSYPTAVMNFCLVLINLRFLWKMSRMGKEYETVKLENDDTFLKYLHFIRGEKLFLKRNEYLTLKSMN